VPVILQDELYETDQHLIGGGGQISGHDLYKPSAMGGGVGGGGGGLPVMLPGDHGGDGHHGIANPHEMDRLLGQRSGMDPFNKAGSLSRPTPAYQRRAGGPGQQI